MASVASDSEHRTLAVTNAGAAVRVTLARPEKRNALSLELMSELIGVLRAIGERSDIRAIVIEGSGVAFSAGHDLGEMVGRELPFYQSLFDRCTELMETIHRVPQPVIAKVHGSRIRFTRSTVSGLRFCMCVVSRPVVCMCATAAGGGTSRWMRRRPIAAESRLSGR